MQSNTQTPESPKLTLKGSVEIEKEITLPYFCKYGDSNFIKVESKRKCVIVHTYNFSYLIEVNNSPSVNIISQSTPILEGEFNQAYREVLSKLQNEAL